MAQNVTRRAEPPGWRAEQALIDCLEELRAQTDLVREQVRGVNDAAFALRADRVLLATSHVLALHLPEPCDGIVLDLEGLERATDNFRPPRVDPDLGQRTDALDRLRSATGLLLRAIQDARHAADEARGADPVARQPIAVQAGHVQAMLRRLDRVEAELRRVAQERDTAPRFVQQIGLVTLYVDKMRVKIDLARLHLTIGDTTIDLGLLTSAVEAMGEITTRFRGAVNAWVGRVTRALTQGATSVRSAVLRVVQGARALGKAAIRASDPARRRFSFEPEMVQIPRGSFTMGVPEAESKREKTEDWDNHARPQHRVTLHRAFLLGKYPVTRAEYAVYARAIGLNWEPPDFEQTERHPAVNVSFEDAVAYAAWLSRRTGRRYRLPSEAEWEYACRAGTETARYWGERPDPKMARFGTEATTNVDAFRPNPWGLHDMLGNILEWVEDQWHENYALAPDDGSAWTSSGDLGHRVVRGGSWDLRLRSDRAGYRVGVDAGDRTDFTGFRVARAL